MVLFVGHGGNIPVMSAPSTVQDFLKSSRCLAQVASQFKDNPIHKLTQDQGLLYVHQAEFAVTHPGDPRVQLMGSEDATTCHIIILRHAKTRVTALAHMDSCQGLDLVMNRATEVAQSVSREPGVDVDLKDWDLFMVGGFEDQLGNSEVLSLNLLEDFIQSEYRFTLKLCVIGSLNTSYDPNFHPKPIFYGCAVNLTTGDVFPATFEDHGPVDILRHCRTSFNSDRSQKRPYDLYDCVSGEIRIQPFPFTYYPGLELWMKAPSQAILDNMSSSPKVEPPYFVSKLKKTIQMVVEHPNPYKSIFSGSSKPLVFSLNDCSQWVCKSSLTG
ncbi:protein N-terminal asparagine amidohydrolase-like [Tigriopus californicus]|uniref:protein N-terminal asparagine amidohydrolase-like n=1 Tax=Tigriopus californicus TaxID=6832 RepID=UPI0027D9E4B8|nr:protein N-terminal asparagine amidohydrolase-like [Tigriopus californicus]